MTCCYCNQELEDEVTVGIEPDIFGAEQGEAHVACRSDRVMAYGRIAENTRLLALACGRNMPDVLRMG